MYRCEFIVPRPQGLSVAADASEFSSQKSGESRWFVAQRVPAEVASGDAPFADNGLKITEQRPQTGEFSTAWQRLMV
jgi:outer membrane protein assembly factor BamC